jgi:hypothetical protein
MRWLRLWIPEPRRVVDNVEMITTRNVIADHEHGSAQLYLYVCIGTRTRTQGERGVGWASRKSPLGPFLAMGLS